MSRVATKEEWTELERLAALMLEAGLELKPPSTYVVYWSDYRVWVRYEVFLDRGDELAWRMLRHTITKEPWKGRVHLVVHGPGSLWTGMKVGQGHAEELTGLVGPPALDRLREVVEGEMVRT